MVDGIAVGKDVNCRRFITIKEGYPFHLDLKCTNTELDGPQLWWRYAFHCVRAQFVTPYSWEAVRAHRARYRALIVLHVRRSDIEMSKK